MHQDQHQKEIAAGCTSAALVPSCLHTATIWTIWQCIREMSGAIQCSPKGCSNVLYQQIESHTNAPAKNFSTWLCWMLSEHTKKHNTAKLRGHLLELFLLVLFFQRQKEHRRLSWEICGSTSSWVVALLLSHRTLFLLPIYPVNLICLDTA